MAASVQIRKDPPSGTIIIDAPDTRNALTRAMVRDIAQGLDDLQQEPRVRVVILTSRGDVFSAGTDLSELDLGSPEEVELGRLAGQAAQWHEDATAIRDLYVRCLRHPKLIVAAVPGPALGIAAGLTAACDLILADEGASWSFPEARSGLVPAIAMPIVAFRWGGALAARLCLAGLTLDAAEAHRLGVVTELVATHDLWSHAHEIGKKMAAMAPESVALAKRVLLETSGETLETLLTVGAAAMATARTTASAREGVSAFREKRRPKWPGVPAEDASE